MLYFFGILSAYLIGSVPTAYILAKIVKGEDIRQFGSGNVGATNAGRMMGRWAFALVLILDALKGFAPVYISLHYLSNSSHAEFLPVFIGASILLGHTFPVYLGFKGGKGVAAGLGVFLALAPYAVLLASLAFILTVLTCRMISAGSIVSVLVLCVAVVIFSSWHALWYFTFIAAFFIIFKHRTNISRIIAGTESKVKIGK